MGNESCQKSLDDLLPDLKNSHDTQTANAFFEKLKHKGQRGEDLSFFYLNSKKAHQQEIVNNLNDFLEGQKNSLLTRKFAKLQRLIRKERDLQEKRSSLNIANYMHSYRKLLFECTSSRWNEVRRVTTGVFTSFMVTMSAASSIANMGWNNREREASDWGRQISYELSSEFGEIFVRSLIISLAKMGALAKTGAMFSFSRTWMIGDSIGFDYFAGISDEDIQKALENVLSSSSDKEELLSLWAKTLEEKNFWQEFRAKYKWPGARPWPNLDKIELENIKKNDFSDEQFSAIMHEAMSTKIYNETKGDWIYLGNRALDRYFFDSLYDFIAAVREVLVGHYIYRNLCMKSLDPKRFVRKAALTFLLTRFLSDTVYFSTRKKAVGF